MKIQKEINAKTKRLQEIQNKENELKVLRLKLQMELNVLDGKLAK